MFGIFKSWKEKQIALVEKQMPIIAELSAQSLVMKAQSEVFADQLSLQEGSTARRKVQAFYLGFLEGVVRDNFDCRQLDKMEIMMLSLKLLCHNAICVDDVKNEKEIHALTSVYLGIFQDFELAQYRELGVHCSWAQNIRERTHLWETFSSEISAEYS